MHFKNLKTSWLLIQVVLAPLGAEPLEKGIKKFFNPDFVAVVQRPASAYSGFPFIIEMGIAYGGDIKSGGPHVYRYANRIPLLYDEGSDVVLKVVNDTDWGQIQGKGRTSFHHCFSYLFNKNSIQNCWKRKCCRQARNRKRIKIGIAIFI